MLHGFPKFVNLTKRTDLIAAEIKRLDADVVVLQEVPWTRATGNVAEVIAKLLGYNYLYYRANGNRNLIFFEEGEAILSRYALKDVVFTTLAPHAGWFERRVAFGATAITPWGEVMFFVVHLTDKKPQVNEGQTEALRNFVEQHSKGMAVVAGDFNARAYLPQIRELAMVWIDAYRFVHPNDEGLTCCIDDLMAIPGEPLEERIDYIFLVHMEGKLVSAEHTFYQPFVSGDGWQWASDHTGLLVEIAP
jgi:endonuclease/exonuclease/phosphatase family metal-dependent hydrolase